MIAQGSYDQNMPAALSSFLDDHHGEIEQEDQRVFLYEKSWGEYLKLLEVRGERKRPRIYYLDGTIELMTTSRGHEGLKKMLARLVEAWADEHDREFNGYGEFTMKRRAMKVGAEADECYFVDGRWRTEKFPELAIEVVWTRGGLRKLDIYARLGVRELWLIGKALEIEVHVLRGKRYVRAERSVIFPELDLSWLAGFMSNDSQTQAVRALRRAMRAKKR